MPGPVVIGDDGSSNPVPRARAATGSGIFIRDAYGHDRLTSLDATPPTPANLGSSIQNVNVVQNDQIVGTFASAEKITVGSGSDSITVQKVGRTVQVTASGKTTLNAGKGGGHVVGTGSVDSIEIDDGTTFIKTIKGAASVSFFS